MAAGAQVTMALGIDPLFILWGSQEPECVGLWATEGCSVCGELETPRTLQSDGAGHALVDCALFSYHWVVTFVLTLALGSVTLEARLYLPGIPDTAPRTPVVAPSAQNQLSGIAGSAQMGKPQPCAPGWTSRSRLHPRNSLELRALIIEPPPCSSDGLLMEGNSYWNPR